jgi:hypothetical protein
VDCPKSLAAFTAWPRYAVFERKASETGNPTDIAELCCLDEVYAQDILWSLFVLVPKLVDKKLQPTVYSRGNYYQCVKTQTDPGETKWAFAVGPKVGGFFDQISEICVSVAPESRCRSSLH